MNKKEKIENRFIVAYLAHEIYTPLEGVRNLLHSLLAEEVIDRERVRLCEKTLEQLTGYLSSTMEMLRLGRDSGAPHITPVKQKDFIMELKNFFSVIYREKQLEVLLKDDLCSYEYLYLDKILFFQIVNNLVSNAVKYTGENGRIRLCLEAEEIEEYRVLLRLEVDDNGCGMGEEFMKKCFSPYEQEQYVPGVGKGLGLYIVREIVDMLGGTISVDSVKGEGTAIKVELEVDGSDERYENKEETSCGRGENRGEGKRDIFVKSRSGRRRKILIAEDNEVFMEWLVQVLGKNGILVDKTYDGYEVMALFEESEPGEYQAILLDLGLPECSGLEAAQKIRKMKHADAAAIPILAYTGMPIEQPEVFLKKYRLQGIIPKVLEENELLEAIERSLREPEKNQEV